MALNPSIVQILHTSYAGAICTTLRLTCAGEVWSVSRAKKHTGLIVCRVGTQAGKQGWQVAWPPLTVDEPESGLAFCGAYGCPRVP